MRAVHAVYLWQRLRDRACMCSSGTGVNDSVVNQLLTKIDGVDALNNILLIGMTNRKDMLDEALLRPGRLEVQVEIGLPDDKGRLQILKVLAAQSGCSSGHACAALRSLRASAPAMIGHPCQSVMPVLAELLLPRL